MNARIATAARLGFREQSRRPLVIVLLLVVPFFFITRAIAATSPLPRRIGLPGGTQILTNMREVHGVTMAAITVAFLTGLCGAFIVNSARQADRRLVVAGFRPFEAIIPRLAVLGAATIVVVGVSVAVTAIGFTPRSWVVFTVGTLLVGLTYGPIGVIAGSLFGELGATYLVLFVAMLGQGILQSPMFGSGTPGGLAVALPDYGATRIVIGGGFSSGFHAWGELGMALGWLTVLVVTTSAILSHLLRRKVVT
jgi:hypothetical protein